ncbi:NAD(P)-binding domain-containing protein [Polaribacter atrinae]
MHIFALLIINIRINMKKPTIGFIGLGLMGGNMVENLQKKRL